jgi:two-component system response regulator NreC
VITIAVVADEIIIRKALRCFLERESDFRTVGHATTGRDAVRLVTRRKPRVLIVGAALPGANGIDLTRQVHEQSPSTRVILVSRFVAEWHLVAALRNGAAGYVSSLAQASDLSRAIRRVASGGHYVSAPLSRQGVEAWVRRVRSGKADDPYETLTTREREVLRLVTEGYSSVRIAGRLSISPRTAESHRANVMRKLGLSNYVELIRYALVRGILPMIDNPARSN